MEQMPQNKRIQMNAKMSVITISVNGLGLKVKANIFRLFLKLYAVYQSTLKNKNKDPERW